MLDMEVFKSIEDIKESNSKYPAKELSDNAKRILESRYLINRYDSTIKGVRKENSFEEKCRRVSRVLAATESIYSEDISWIQKLEANIYDDMLHRRFMFNSPALFNLGIDMTIVPLLARLIYDEPTIDIYDYREIYQDHTEFQMAFACFVIPVDDSIIGIYDSVKNAALISMKGGGVGTNFGRTRERGGSIRHGNGGVASGPISWMRQWNTMAEEVVQGGKRRAALMGMLDINHPDIEDFICAKDEDGVLSYFNLSVAITDEFMKAVLDEDPNKEFELVSRIDPKRNVKVNAKELWHKLCEHAWKRGDPGIHFTDTSNRDNILKLNKQWVIEATNPCGEMNLPLHVQDAKYKSYSISDNDIKLRAKEYPSSTTKPCDPSEDGSCCNLGSINLMAFYDRTTEELPYESCMELFDWRGFKEQIRRSIYYLDLMIDTSEYPLEGIKNNAHLTRPVGLGIMGLADLGISMHMPFVTDDTDSPFAKLCTKIAETLGIESLIASVDIVNEYEKPAFPESECVKDLFQSINLNTREPRSVLAMRMLNTDAVARDLPPSLFNTLLSMIDNEDYSDQLIDKIMYNLSSNHNIRNSRRLSIAPTGTISMLCDASAGIEPNFSYMYDRKVTVNDGKGGTNIEILKYFHPLIPDKYKKELENTGHISDPVYLNAREISPENHIGVVSIFSRFVDASISKTINLPSETTVKEIEDIYIDCYKKHIKGITIYRDGSRSTQPIVDSKPKEDKSVEEKPAECKCEKKILTREKRCPDKGTGEFIKIATPYGKIYVMAKFNEKHEMCELFITLNKSGQEFKAITEAISRNVSILLQEAEDYEHAYKRIIKSLNGISGFEYFVYDGIRSHEEHIARSIPDLISYVMPDLEFMHLCNVYGSEEEANKHMIAPLNIKRGMNQYDIIDVINPLQRDVKQTTNNPADNSVIERYNKHKAFICSECGSTQFYYSEGCARCASCGASKCAIA